jgi:carboxylate-amine ligase
LRETEHGRLKTELFASVVEVNTSVSADAAEALARVRGLRRAAADAAARHGLVVAAAGTHPRSVPEEQPITGKKRYQGFVDYAGRVARRQGCNGLHVHVGMESGDACLRVLERVLPWLPVVLALSANSPYLAGVETGLLSTRAEILGLLPRHGAPPAFASYADWERYVERMRATELPLTGDYTLFWWDIRPHPRFGTLEIRMPDQPTSVELTGALTALLQALCLAVSDGAASDPVERADYQLNRWTAARFGPRARLIHPDGCRSVDVARLTEELHELVAHAATELGSTALLAPLDPLGCEADRQLELGREQGLEAVVRDLAGRTLRSL